MKIDVLKLHRLQREKAMTNRDISRITGISETSISILRKTGNVRPVTALLIADAMKVDVNELLPDEALRQVESK